jgi:hypothetical protein
VRWAWEAMTKVAPEVLGELLALDAQWYGVQDGQFCESRRVSSKITAAYVRIG